MCRDEIRGGGGAVEPLALLGELVQGEKCAAHGERVAEIRPGGIALVVPEAAPVQTAVGDYPLCCALRLGTRSGGAGDRGELGERGDDPAVLAGIDVGVDARHAAGAAAGIVECKEIAAVFAGDEVGVLRGVDDPVGAGEKRAEIAMDGPGAGEVGGITPLGVGQRVEAEVLRLHLHDLLEVWLVPIAAGGVLVNAAPDGIDELALEAQGVARHFRRAGIAAGGVAQGEFDGVPVEVFVREAPAAFLVVVTIEPFRAEGGVVLGGEGRGVRGRAGGRALGAGGRAGGRVGDHGLEQARHRAGRDVALALHQLGAVGGEDNGGRPTEVLVAVGNIGARILVHPDREVAAVQQGRDRGVAVGRLRHDVAPVAPHRLEIEQHEFVFPFRLREDLRRPLVPDDGFRRPGNERSGGQSENEKQRVKLHAP